MRLAGKVAIVTGAGSGIGRACALAFAGEGAKVVLVGRTAKKLESLANEIGPAALVHVADVSRRSDNESAVAAAVSKFGALHVLVNNAGTLFAGTAESHTEEEWDQTFGTNVKGMWLLSRAALPQMRRASGGSIINIGSVLSLVGARNRVAYAASKGAVLLMTRSMALDHGAEQIRVNCVCPGIVETELVEKFISQAPDPAAARKQREALHALGRFGQPEDIAPVLVYLASDESRWVTGGAFSVDGGYTAV